MTILSDLKDFPTTYSEAKEKGSKFYYTGIICRKGHFAKRYTSSGDCTECRSLRNKNGIDKHREYCRGYRKDNKKRYVMLKSRHYQENKVKYAAKSAINYQNNKEEYRRHGITFRRNNPDKCKEYSIKWKGNNKGATNSDTARRRAGKIKRTPLWLTRKEKESIKELYIKARALTKSTRISHHVDHIIPLQGRFVSGLHVPDNLQILKACDNLSKGNKFNSLQGHI